MTSEVDLENAFFEIGVSVAGHTRSGRGGGRQELITVGQRWLHSNKRSICEMLSSETATRWFIGPHSTTEEQIRALTDIIIAVKFAVPPNALAKAVVILGRSWFCGP